MRENQTINEDIIVRRVQRRLERYFSDLEKPKTDNQADVFEASGTKIVTLSTESKLTKPMSAVPEKKLPAPPLPPPTARQQTQPPPPPVAPKTTVPKPPLPESLPPLQTSSLPPIPVQTMTPPQTPNSDVFAKVGADSTKSDSFSGFPSELPAAFNESNNDPFEPSKTTRTQLPNTSVPNLPSMTPPIFGKDSNPAKIAPLSQTPTSGISKDTTTAAKSSSFIPIFMFFLALVAAFGLLLAWYWFTGGAGEPTITH